MIGSTSLPPSRRAGRGARAPHRAPVAAPARRAPRRSIAAVATTLGAALAAAAAPAAAQTSVDLRTWSAESYPAVSGFSPGVWTVAPDGQSVRQSVNGQPTLFVSDFSARAIEVTGRVRVNSQNDDDFIGFALGYRPGDTGNAAADYLLVDWKAATQFFNFGAPSTTPGATAFRGLAASRVRGVPTADEMWGHVDFPSDAAGGVEELQRGATLGDVGWQVGRTYEFRFVFLPNLLQVFVDGVQQIDVGGSFADGRLAFYNFSQADVTYSAFTRTDLPDPTIVPEPGTVVLLGAGLLTLAGVTVRRRRAPR